MHCCFGVLVLLLLPVPTCIFPRTLSPPSRRQSCRFPLSESSTFSAEQARRTDDIFMLLFRPLSRLCTPFTHRVRKGTPKGGRTRGQSFSTTTPSGLTWGCPSMLYLCSPSSGDPRQPEPQTWDQWWCTAGMMAVTNHPWQAQLELSICSSMPPKTNTVGY